VKKTLIVMVLLSVVLIGGRGPSPLPVHAQGGWFNPAWGYRVPITIDNSSGSALSGYQVLITLDAGSFDFTHAQADGRDVRATDGDGVTLLPFWIESWDAAGQLARVWIRVPSIPAAGSTTVYLYYGNPAALAAGDGDATFELFDDEWRQFGGGSGRNPVLTAGQPWWEANVSFPVVFEDMSFSPDRPRFHMLYDGHAVIGHAKGYATSPDLVHWTEYNAGDPHPPNPNPIMGTGYTGNAPFAWGDVIKVGTTYYMYVSRGPGTIYRTESTDLVTWTNFTAITGGSFGTGAAILKEGDGITPITVDGRYWMVYFPGRERGRCTWQARRWEGTCWPGSRGPAIRSWRRRRAAGTRWGCGRRRSPGWGTATTSTTRAMGQPGGRRAMPARRRTMEVGGPSGRTRRCGPSPTRTGMASRSR
jgi:hypothetical protein